MIKGELCSIFISINDVFINTILSIIKKKFVSTCLCIKTAVFQYSGWKTVWFAAATGLRNRRHLFYRPWPCFLTSSVLSSVNRSCISLYVLSSRKIIKMPTCRAPNYLLTEKTNPGYSFFTLPWNNKFKLDSWLKKLKLFHPPTWQLSSDLSMSFRAWVFHILWSSLYRI